ncbi:hypothetical protein SCHPADRAFT_852173 [Schizopora paradoxa]|uniref:Uncharacterized protein n=1 Tax=Schizopora paradoxa TaxID=27342 RepID=A0A0H2RPT9_9AGAM|nr:hypothetical protein SCHPADRAFT_852173 [Schizopora paradoxa]
MAMHRRSRSPQTQLPKHKGDHRDASASTDLLTFRWNSDMVYITPSSDFEELLNTAQQVFPQLLSIPRERIAFSVNTRIGADQRAVRISPKAWSRLLGSLARFEIVDVHVLPFAPRGSKSDTDVCSLRGGDVDVPPQYEADSKSTSSQFLSVPSNSPQLSRRSSSALGWFGEKLR